MSKYHKIDDGEYTIIDDGAYKYPVETALLSNTSEQELKAMNDEQYQAWCNEVGCDDTYGTVGSRSMIEYCQHLSDECASDTWYIG